MEIIHQTIEMPWSFEELDLDGAYEELTSKQDKLLAIQTYLVNQYCALPFGKLDSELGLFLRNESDRISSEFKRLSTTVKSLRKIRHSKH
ncbi:hypothetical protein [Bacillus sp. T33-2]|uniref:hypothetical protein n=1 Tax=Bacillus sp. T33-2 TaxID=2054168 RepID=UPI000C7639D9|nr:hypothetical protein [Bacillus sp. T33-2]PLR93232.1 hypothetical protein CVD19_19715 [Bacillus sp. T33-2]